jgi:tetratricopeptide (TPR) repeat protein
VRDRYGSSLPFLCCDRTSFKLECNADLNLFGLVSEPPSASDWQKLNEDAQDLAALLSLFAPVAIPWQLVQACLPTVYAPLLNHWRDAQLVAQGWLQCDDAMMYHLSPSVRNFAVTTEAMQRSYCAVMAKTALQISLTITPVSTAQTIPLLPHLKEAFTTLADWLADEDLILPMIRIGQFYQDQAQFAEAEEWFLQCRAIATQRLGAMHPDVTISLNRLAGLYRLQGRYRVAEQMMLQVLEIQQWHLESEDPEIAVSLAHLAALTDLQGRIAEAEQLYLRSLMIWQRQLEPDPPEMTSSLTQLAALYVTQGRLTEAKPLLLQAVDLCQKRLGAQHPETLQVEQSLESVWEMSEAQ